MSDKIKLTPAMNQWLSGGNRGASSDTIITHLTGVPCLLHDGADHPKTLHDFGRCQSLLDKCPELIPALPALAELSPEWAAIVQHWSRIEYLWREYQKDDPDERLIALDAGTNLLQSIIAKAQAQNVVFMPA